MLEVITTIAILGIILTMAVPNLHKPLARYRLQSTGMQLAADLRWVRQQSIYGKATVVHIWFSLPDNFYMVRDGTKIIVYRTLPPGIRFAEVELQQRPFTFTLSGAPGGGGRIVLKNDYGERCYVYIMPSTGRIRVEMGKGQ
ncbi:MAG TPA: hypothetical protein GXX34_09510 [Clostridia bacterium]|nr:hypothetical protein [Clostridia bacterium]